MLEDLKIVGVILWTTFNCLVRIMIIVAGMYVALRFLLWLLRH